MLTLPIVLFSQTDNHQKKILMVLTSYGKYSGESRHGYEFDEFSQAYLIFQKNNLEIDVASPKGGKVEADKFNKDIAYKKSVLNNKEILDVLYNTTPSPLVDPTEYDAI